MTSTSIVRAEIVRFLKSEEPEVICISGEWGVGKTFTWQAGLDEVKANGSHALSRYSYVSLFGINSLEAFKLALFENLDFLDTPASSLIEKGWHNLKIVSARAKKLNQLASEIPYVGKLLSKAGPLYFSMVHHQIICIDDIERRGEGLDLKDIFGLVSFLREQRACKVALLLNADALGGDKKDFDKYFEKVIDALLVFAPTAAEATEIALKGNDKETDLLRQNCEALGISNIRVIKKIERLVRQLAPELKGFTDELYYQAIHSLTLFGWSKFQPQLAPPLEFYRVSSTARYLEMRAGKKPSSEEEKWTALLTQYNFSSVDEFDAELMRFVDTGVLDKPKLIARATEQNSKLENVKRSGSLEKAWRPFHDSFESDVDNVTSSIMQGMKESIDVVSLANLDAAVTLLKEIDKFDEAQELLRYYSDRKPPEYWDPSNDPFERKLVDPDVVSVSSEARQKIKEVPFDF
jgi:hypothetical protein